MSRSRCLIVMRHAKAESFADSDHERVLTDRGGRNAADAGRHLAETGLAPDHAVVSSATRAQETWAAVAQAFSPEQAVGVEVAVDTAVYYGSADVVLDVLRAVPEHASVVMFVGHNPSAGDLVNRLDDGEGDPEAIDAMLHGFPAGALVVYDVGGSWSELGEQTGRVRDFYVGRG